MRWFSLCGARPLKALTPIAISGALGLSACSPDGSSSVRSGHSDGGAKVPDGGAAESGAPPRGEAGFVEVGPGSGIGVHFSSRMFYSFKPAEIGSSDAPILVFFNGGPGAATTSVLWPYGTGPYTLHTEDAPADPPSVNPFPYTRFANLLYIDARSTGFSYELGDPPAADAATGCDQTVGGLYIWDASDFVMTLLEFLDAHEALTDNPVVLVGESFGGTRATVMLSLLQHYAVASTSTNPSYPTNLTEHVPWLHDRVQAHFDLAFPATAGKERTADEVALQFGWQALIQPDVLTTIGVPGNNAATDPDLAVYYANPGTRAQDDVRRPLADVDRISLRTAAAVRNPESLALLLGMDPADVPRLSPARGRDGSFRILHDNQSAEIATQEIALRNAIGVLAADDAYWMPTNTPCEFADSTGYGSLLEEILGRTQTFITNCKYDAIIYGDAVRDLFVNAFGGTYDTSSPAGSPRPGVVRFQFDGKDIAIRIPEYESGHEVTFGSAREFGEDLAEWMVTTGATKKSP